MKKKIRIVGGTPLYGQVNISGSKNSISAIFPALCLAGSQADSVIKGVPNVEDTTTLCAILEEAGLTVKRERRKNIVNVKGTVHNNILSSDNVPKIRASSLFLGALLSSTGEVRMPFCGGDNIGERPLDIHFYVFDKFKINTEIIEGCIHCKAAQFPLKGTTIFLRYPSVGATQNAILLAVKAQGFTYIYNAACEPEVSDLAVLLNKMGADISGAGTPFLRVRGVESLKPAEHEVIPDRLEACTFMLAFASTRGKGEILGAIPEHCISVMNTLSDAGVNINCSDSVISVDSTSGKLKAIKASALPYPGIPTDIQPLLSVFALQCEGNSIIDDNVFKDRFAYLTEYVKMGVNIMRMYDRLSMTGPQVFKNAVIHGNDIRAVSSMILAALVAKDESIVYGYEHLIRGYDGFVKKLKLLGAQVEVI